MIFFVDKGLTFSISLGIAIIFLLNFFHYLVPKSI